MYIAYSADKFEFLHKSDYSTDHSIGTVQVCVHYYNPPSPTLWYVIRRVSQEDQPIQ